MLAFPPKLVSSSNYSSLILTIYHSNLRYKFCISFLKSATIYFFIVYLYIVVGALLFIYDFTFGISTFMAKGRQILLVNVFNLKQKTNQILPISSKLYLFSQIMINFAISVFHLLYFMK